MSQETATPCMQYVCGGGRTIPTKLGIMEAAGGARRRGSKAEELSLSKDCSASLKTPTPLGWGRSFPLLGYHFCKS